MGGKSQVLPCSLTIRKVIGKIVNCVSALVLRECLGKFVILLLGGFVGTLFNFFLYYDISFIVTEVVDNVGNLLPELELFEGFNNILRKADSVYMQDLAQGEFSGGKNTV